jgi:hypothetical protein
MAMDDNANKNGKAADVKPPVSSDTYKDDLKNLSHQDVVDGLLEAGIDKVDAEDFAQQVDKDR